MQYIIEWLCLIPVAGGSLYSFLCLISVMAFRFYPPSVSGPSFTTWPPVTILKPVCGLEKNLRENLRSACLLDYPDYQVVFTVQDPCDPAIPLLKEICEEFGNCTTISVGEIHSVPNGKVRNMLGAMAQVRHDIMVISDSDVLLRPDYLKHIIPPLANPQVGCVCTLYKVVGAKAWFEKLDLLTLNADFIPNVIFAHMTGAASFCTGASTAFRRSFLDKIGGLEPLGHYVAEDYEMGRRMTAAGKKIAIVPYFIDIINDLQSPSHWWRHQLYWDQNTRSSKPGGFFATVIIRAVPFALLFASIRGFDVRGLAVLGVGLAIRLSATASILKWGLRDSEGLKNLAFLPMRDVISLVTWVTAFIGKTVTWRGSEYILMPGGRWILKEKDSKKTDSLPPTSFI